MREIDEIYWNICNHLICAGAPVGNTLELNNFCVTLRDINENIVSIRDISPCYLLGEWLWYFTARNDVKFISIFGKMWERLTDDGVTNNSAYGYIMKKKFGFDQIEKIIELLSKDPNSRRAVININTPNERVIETKDEPCTIGLQFLIRNNKLYCTAIMRSNDVYLGFPYDVAFFTELQKYIADRLGVGYGDYTHFATSLHVYARDLEKLVAIRNKPESKRFTINRKNFHECKDMAVELIEPLIDKWEYYGKSDLMVIFEQLGIYKED